MFTARSPASYHFTVRPFAVFGWTVGGASEEIFLSISMTGYLPNLYSTFAALPILPPFPPSAGFIYRGALQAWEFPWKFKHKESFYSIGEEYLFSTVSSATECF